MCFHHPNSSLHAFQNVARANGRESFSYTVLDEISCPKFIFTGTPGCPPPPLHWKTVGADYSQIKEEQEDVCISREGEQFGLKQETHAFDEDAPQLHDCKEEEVLTVQQLCNQEEQDAAQVKEEGEELCSSREEEDLGLKQETDTFMVTPTDEDSDKNETEPDSEQLLSHNSPDTESQDQGAGKNVNPRSSKDEEPQPKKRLHRKRSDRDNVDNSMPENQCDTDTG
ncbi:uncharacterized protein KZ484_026697 [Pholidichthys leucotaenia]